jgi:hypothetical protein
MFFSLKIRVEARRPRHNNTLRRNRRQVFGYGISQRINFWCFRCWRFISTVNRICFFYLSDLLQLSHQIHIEAALSKVLGNKMLSPACVQRFSRSLVIRESVDRFKSKKKRRFIPTLQASLMSVCFMVNIGILRGRDRRPHTSASLAKSRLSCANLSEYGCWTQPPYNRP